MKAVQGYGSGGQLEGQGGGRGWVSAGNGWKSWWKVLVLVRLW